MRTGLKLAGAFNARGLEYLEEGEMSKALADFHKALYYDPGNEEYQENYDARGGVTVALAAGMERCSPGVGSSPHRSSHTASYWETEFNESGFGRLVSRVAIALPRAGYVLGDVLRELAQVDTEYRFERGE